MSKLHIILISLAVLLLIGGLAYFLITQVFSKSKEPLAQTDESLTPALKKICEGYKQPAMACALISGDQVVAKASVGTAVWNENNPVDLNSRFHIGSTTKSMTALLIEMLVDEGKLRYDMTLAEALPDTEMFDDYKQVTIDDLLLHKTGIIAFQTTDTESPDIAQKLWYDIPSEYPDPTKQRQQLAQVVLNLKPINKPGTTPVYSNVGYAILGLVAETATGQSFEELLKEKIFTPLGMNSARVGGWPASSEDPNHPRGHYTAADHSLVSQKLEDEYIFPNWMNPAGGVHCTINDFALYARENLMGLQGKGELLDKAHYENIHRVHLMANINNMYPSMKQKGELPLGYGWAVLSDAKGNISTADGSGGTFYATLIVYPGMDVAFAGFTNSGDGKKALNAAIRRMTGFEWN